MQEITSMLASKFKVKDIDFDNSQWHLAIPSSSGWYFIETNTPIEVLVNLSSPPSKYTNNDGDQKKCRNYNISSRAGSLLSCVGSDGVIGGQSFRVVYSGMAKNLLNRAREHTFAHLGTAGLALANYQEIKDYDWKFHYLINTIVPASKAHRNVILKLGEQIWRASNGWPILCAG
ncbi:MULTISPECIES: hypothetical protein [Kangiella]|uniref:Uncharacterized protein n=1 Tax=Kangiella koreensis (strain DSM 16069 / JCM 12317 / KCTC 12182 / SW-125) TaxID=523791 RepID=C7RBM8_KANKD|nr:hypothetical protein [Kangiella koreensis]ACV26670.1 hypothetical protein Kkor_1251 [Kangiella koreensis DSM 16069]